MNYLMTNFKKNHNIYKLKYTLKQFLLSLKYASEISRYPVNYKMVINYN
jgi:hypothetical protein